MMNSLRQPLSPFYRNDPDGELDTEIAGLLDKEYFLQLDNIATSNPKLLVVFAGGNAVGKSTLAERLSRELGGLRLENDGIKRVLLGKYSELAATDELHNLTWQYTMSLYRRLSDLTSNGLVIRDGVITWYYDRILPIFTDAGYELFVVGYDLSEHKTRELIAARGDTATVTAERLYQIMPDQKIHLQRFFDHYDADIMLNDDSVFDHERVVGAVQHRLRQLRQD